MAAVIVLRISTSSLVEKLPQGGSLDLHGETGQRAMRLAGLEAEFAAAGAARGPRRPAYDVAGTLLFDRNKPGDDRPEIDRTVLRQILLDSLVPGTVQGWSQVTLFAEAMAARAEMAAEGAAQGLDGVFIGRCCTGARTLSGANDGMGEDRSSVRLPRKKAVRFALNRPVGLTETGSSMRKRREFLLVLNGYEPKAPSSLSMR